MTLEKGLLTLVIACVLGASAAGCGGSACDDLDCAACDGEGLRSACQEVVSQDNEDLCEAAVDSAEYESCQ